MKKKTLGLIAGICSLGMMLSLSACGSNGGSSAKGSSEKKNELFAPCSEA